MFDELFMMLALLMNHFLMCLLFNSDFRRSNALSSLVGVSW